MANLRIVAALAGMVMAAGHLVAQDKPAGPALLEAENDVTVRLGKTPARKAVPVMALSIGDKVETGESSRATLRLTDLSIIRLDEFTTQEIVPDQSKSGKPALDMKQGGAYFFSRERAPEVRITTPAANGALRGTQLVVRVTPGQKTLLTVFEGEVELWNEKGRVVLSPGEQGEAEIGKAPKKTAVIDAVNIIQWALYYPAVLDAMEAGLSAHEKETLAASLKAYQAGDLLGALEKYPRGYQPASAAARTYRAAVLLAVGRVDDAQQAMASLPAGLPGRLALEEMIAAVKFRDWTHPRHRTSAGEWLADSYYLQSKSQLVPALASAHKATELAPGFGYAWVRVAELEFSFGRTPQALKALERGLELNPRNAQAHALRGFLLSAQNRISPAREAFNQAIHLDGALGNGWLGRGLTQIRQDHEDAGRQDLQIAATLEPNRSILHSYLGKAFSQAGEFKPARKDFTRAKELDPNDPTPWLYSAIENKQENRYNAAVTDLEKSLELNDNRRVYRSRFLLDQDRGVRSANLASIYLNNGMTDLSVREATRAVNADYSSASAHLFLSNSFDALRDPRRNLLRYETVWFNELLLSNLLSPVGGGSLSQFVSQQEYSKLFEADGLGISSLTEYFSDGELRETASQYGTSGNVSYALDAEYFYNNGRHANNEISRLETYATFKLQLTPQDTIFLKLKYQNLETGDLTQRFDQRQSARTAASLTFDFREQQEPGLALVGYHHEWAPGVHTLALFGRLANEQTLTASQTGQLLFERNLDSPANLVPLPGVSGGGLQILNPSGQSSSAEIADALRGLSGRGQLTRAYSTGFDLDYRASFEIYSGELSQIITAGNHTLIFGSRYQKGTFHTADTLDGLPADVQQLGQFKNPPADQDFSVDFQRLNLYAYDIWRVAPWLSLTGGVTYDQLSYPENFRSVPLNDRQESFDKVSPKAGFILTPNRSLVLRGAYSEAISGASFDESVRLEPTQIAGFSQAYRTIISEDVAGSVAGATYKTWGLSLEQKLPTRTYWAIEYNLLTQDLDRTIGVFDLLRDPGSGLYLAALPSSTGQKITYREDVLSASLNQLVGQNWSLGTRYRLSRAKLHTLFTDLPTGFADGGSGALFPADTTRTALLHEVDFFALYNHPCGFFARAEARWFKQENDAFSAVPQSNTPLQGDNFWQLNALAGYRFYRNQCEISAGVLNIANHDYQIDPLNYFLELPRERTFVARLKFTF